MEKLKSIASMITCIAGYAALIFLSIWITQFFQQKLSNWILTTCVALFSITGISLLLGVHAEMTRRLTKEETDKRDPGHP